MFDFSNHMRLLCEDVVRHTPGLGHVDISRVAVTFAQARTRSRYGTQAKLTPMRFAGGAVTGVRGGRRYRSQTLTVDGREMLYILTFYLPRFLDLTPRAKLTTVVHELYHISEHFDGDIRRLPGRHFAHSSSRKRYEAVVEQLTDQYLARSPDGQLRRFLDHTFEALQSQHGGVCGLRVPIPRLIPVSP